MRIVHALARFDVLAGTQLHVFELARVLTKRGHDVTIATGVAGGVIAERARAAGADVTTLTQSVAAPDVLHVHDSSSALAVLAKHPRVPAVASVHSPWPADAPLVVDRIRAYVCVRPEIRDKVVRWDFVPRERTLVLLNPIDFERFRPEPPPVRERPLVLVVGTFADTRRPLVHDLVERAEREQFDLRLVGAGPGAYANGFPATVQRVSEEIWNVEDEVLAADEVAGNFVGRYALEGWACGRTARVYTLTPSGDIASVERHPPPPAALRSLFDAEHVADELERLYAQVAA